MNRNFNYKRHHLLLVLESCQNWANFEDAYNYITKSGAYLAYEPGLTLLRGYGISDLHKLEAEVKRRYKEYGS